MIIPEFIMVNRLYLTDYNYKRNQNVFAPFLSKEISVEVSLSYEGTRMHQSCVDIKNPINRVLRAIKGISRNTNQYVGDLTVFSSFLYNTFSRAEVKSSLSELHGDILLTALLTRMRLSLRASRPASARGYSTRFFVLLFHLLQTALISAPERSSFVITSSSRSTSSANDILEVCSLNICRLVFVSGKGNSSYQTDHRCEHTNFSVYTARTDESGIKRLNLEHIISSDRFVIPATRSISGHDNFDISPRIKSVKLIE